MTYQKRECPVNFEIDCSCTGWETFRFSFDETKHRFTTASTVGEMLGKLIDVLYELYIERISVYEDEFSDCPVKCIHGKGGVIKKLQGSISLDYEGPVLVWTITRGINPCSKTVNIHLDYYDDQKQVYDYQVELFDLFYAVSKGVTKLIKATGFCGYHYMTERDCTFVNDVRPRND